MSSGRTAISSGDYLSFLLSFQGLGLLAVSLLLLSLLVGMEEAEATPRKIRAIHAAGKEAIVWTVNTPSSISKFVNSEIDGIISDHPRAVLEAMQESRSLSDYRAIRQKIFGY